MAKTRWLALILAMFLAACNMQGPSLLGHPGLDSQIRFFYNDRATENNFTCNLPEMSITRATILEDTPERLVLNVAYRWTDRTFGQPFGLQLGVGGCGGFSERVFTMARRTDGTLQVVEMSGPQRSRG
jgi:hypothetical protein